MTGDNQQIKKQIIDEQMAEFWKFCSSSLDKYYAESTDEPDRVIPNSIQEFSEIFLGKLTKLVEAI